MAKKKKTCPSPGNKRKFNGKAYILKSTHKKKGDAVSVKDASKKKGCNVRIIKGACGNQVYQRCTK